MRMRLCAIRMLDEPTTGLAQQGKGATAAYLAARVH